MLFIFLVFFSLVACSQDTDNKVKKALRKSRVHNSILVISSCWGNCRPKAFRITGKKVEIDSNYDDKNNTFTPDKKEILTDNILYPLVKGTTSADFKRTETILKSINCDFAMEIKIIKTQKGKIEFYTFKCFTNCYPKSILSLMGGLDKYFISKSCVIIYHPL